MDAAAGAQPDMEKITRASEASAQSLKELGGQLALFPNLPGLRDAGFMGEKLEEIIKMMTANHKELKDDIKKLKADIKELKDDNKELNSTLKKMEQRMCKAFNRTCSDGMAVSFEVVRFPDGSDPTQPPHELPPLCNVEDLKKLTGPEMKTYLEGYNAVVPKGLEERRRALARTIGCAAPLG
eukprot:comp19032_c0_seq4/m.21447 comp19032_c0_seq4/g.21447  ORF comp19032_c0_seq4/g.21447 comp19032_c0_seq4/m.21447 type:complete len:182 (-) comp19032_c0_seq4:457-1002(-)